MMMEEREVIRTKDYTNRATGLQNFKQVRKAPKNLWKKEIVDKGLELRRGGQEITDGNRIDFLEDEEEDVWTNLLENEGINDSDDEPY